MRRLSLTSALLSAWLVAPAALAHSDQRLPGGDPVRWHRASVDFVVDPTMFDAETLPDPLPMVRAASGVWAGIAHVPRFEVRVAPLTSNHPVQAITYQGVNVEKYHIPPTQYYMDLVIQGAFEVGLSMMWISYLQSFSTQAGRKPRKPT